MVISREQQLLDRARARGTTIFARTVAYVNSGIICKSSCCIIVGTCYVPLPRATIFSIYIHGVENLTRTKYYCLLFKIVLVDQVLTTLRGTRTPLVHHTCYVPLPRAKRAPP